MVMDSAASWARRLLSGVVFLLLCSGPVEVRAEILPRISTEQVYVDTPFAVTFEISGADSASPDLEPLARDFDVVGSSRSSHLTLENGRMQRKQQLTLTLTARRSGEIELPSLSFGDRRSRAVALTVRPQDTMPSDAEQVKLEVTVDPGEVVVQQQVIVSVRVLRPRSVDLDSARLSDPVVSGGDAMVESLGKDRAFTLERDGVRFDAIERRFAVVPQSSGLLTLEPLLLEARRVSGGLGLSNPFGVQIQPVQLRSEAQQIRVKPAPALAQGERWLPAASLTLTEAWSGLDEAGRARVGEPIVRTIGVLADGVTAVQLPTLEHPVPESVNQYVESPNLATQRNPDGLSAQRTEKRILIPVRAGTLDLPAVELRWWNLEQGRFEVASLPARTVDVLPAAGQPADIGQAQTTAPAVVDGPWPEQKQPLPNAPPTPDSREAESAEQQGWAGGAALPRLLWLLTGIVLGALLTRSGWLVQSGRGANTVGEVETRKTDSFNRLLARTLEAAAQDDAEAAQKGLIELANQWPTSLSLGHRPTPVRSLADLESQTTDDALRTAVRDLQKHRYALPDSVEGQWVGRGLREALRDARPAHTEPGAESGLLAPRLAPLKPDARAGNAVQDRALRLRF